MDNQQLKNELFKKLKALIEETQQQFPARFYNSDVNKYQRLNNQKFYFLQKFIKIVKDLLKLIENIHTEINTELNEIITTNKNNINNVNKIRKEVKSNTKLISNLLNTTEKEKRLEKFIKNSRNYVNNIIKYLF